MSASPYRIAAVAAVAGSLFSLSALGVEPGGDRAGQGRAAAPNGVAAFPGAQGAGAESRGGRGGKVHIVTTLADSGEGSLRACVEAAGPRICVFAVGGTIELKKTLHVTNPYLTVAGQTAPGGGVQLTNSVAASAGDLSSVVLISTHDVIWTYTRIRNRRREICADNGVSECGALFAIESSNQRRTYNIIASNNSLAWNQDEGFGVWSGAGGPLFNVTLSMNLIAEGLSSHSTGVLAGGGRSSLSQGVQDIDLHHNIIMSNGHRNPLMVNRSARVINNIFYNQCFYVGQFGGGGYFDVIGNDYVKGPLSREGVFHEVQGFSSLGGGPAPGSPSLHLAGNRGWSQPDPVGDQWEMARRVLGENGAEIGAAPTSWRRADPLPATAFPISIEPVEAIAKPDGAIVTQVGASRRLDCDGRWVANRDPVDARLIGQYVENEGVRALPEGSEPYVRLPVLASGNACVDKDRDGMPDAWELARFGELGQGPADDADRDGYTNIEAYLYGLSASRGLSGGR